MIALPLMTALAQAEEPLLVAHTWTGLARYALADAAPVVFSSWPPPSRGWGSLTGHFSSAPLLSPGGESVVYTSGQELTIVATGDVGTPVVIRRASDDPSEPFAELYTTHSWSPSGRYLIVSIAMERSVITAEGEAVCTLPRATQPAGWEGDTHVLSLGHKGTLRWTRLSDCRTEVRAEIGSSPLLSWWRAGVLTTWEKDAVYRDGEAWFSVPGGAEGRGRLSPDGQRMAFLVGETIHVAEVGSSTTRPLAQCGSLCTFYWHGDDALVFVSGVHGPHSRVGMDGEVALLPLVGAPVLRGSHR